MMISPEEFIAEHKNKSYEELLPIREELLAEIQAFEDHTYDPELDFIHPSPEVMYQCNLEYIGELYKLIAEKYNMGFIAGEQYNKRSTFSWNLAPVKMLKSKKIEN